MLVVGCCLLFVVFVRCLLFVVRCVSFVDCRLVCVVSCTLFVVLFVACCLRVCVCGLLSVGC